MNFGQYILIIHLLKESLVQIIGIYSRDKLSYASLLLLIYVATGLKSRNQKNILKIPMAITVCFNQKSHKGVYFIS